MRSYPSSHRDGSGLKESILLQAQTSLVICENRQSINSRIHMERINMKVHIVAPLRVVYLKTV